MIFSSFNRGEQFYQSSEKRDISLYQQGLLVAGGTAHVNTFDSGYICCSFPTALKKVFLRAVSHKWKSERADGSANTKCLLTKYTPFSKKVQLILLPAFGF